MTMAWRKDVSQIYREERAKNSHRRRCQIQQTPNEQGCEQRAEGSEMMGTYVAQIFSLSGVAQVSYEIESNQTLLLNRTRSTPIATKRRLSSEQVLTDVEFGLRHDELL